MKETKQKQDTYEDKDRANGTLSLYSSLQLTEQMQGLDEESKLLLAQIPVLAVILKGCVREYADYPAKEIEGLIEADSISIKETEVSNNRTNDMVRGVNTEFSALNEILSRFDILFHVRNPRLSSEKILVNLHIDIESQKDYRPGYPVEKRGIYYLARKISSQIPIVTDDTNYGTLEKCYTIFICRDRIPKREQYTITRYGFVTMEDSTYTNISKENYDLAELIVIRLGQAEYEGEKGVLDFLNIIFYPHKEDFINRLEEYVDLNSYEELKEEVSKVSGLGESILEEGIEKGSDMKLIDLVCRKLKKGKETSVIAEELEEELEVVEQICEAAKEAAPEYDVAEIYKKLHMVLQ